MTRSRSERQSQGKAASGGAKRKLGAVLAPIDFSPESLRALDYAAVLLNFLGGSLHLVYVHDLDYAYDGRSLVGVPRAKAIREIERHYGDRLSAVASGYPVASPPRSHVRIGRAFDEICRLAEEVKARLIVISTHGRTGLKRAFLGSTAERVVRHAPCPVLVVIVLAAGWVGRRFLRLTSPAVAMAVGLVALFLLLLAEVGVGVLLRGMSIYQVLVDRDPIAGSLYYGLLVLFAVLPWWRAPSAGKFRLN